ncbi:MAG: hypothetical protein K2N94_14360 [Lachnospiraceae bacterium]|nr:hypothetical protein [Lachnospiraceae bacterium]
MPLKSPELMAELFTLLNRTPTLVYQNAELNEAFNNAILLEENEQAIAAAGQYSIREILYGRYYWYTKFLCCYEAAYGKDAGMEQAQFKIIEAMDYEGIVDCGILESIERELGRDTQKR